MFVKVHKYVLKLIYYKYNMLALYQKDKKKKKKKSRTALYGFLKIQNHQVSNLNRNSQQVKIN
jgi:hypothetical protein